MVFASYVRHGRFPTQEESWRAARWRVTRGHAEEWSHPQTNGICERFHRTIQEEFYATAFRKKLYTSLEEMQTDLDAWLDEYNRTRPHSGKYCYGKTPMQTFVDSLSLTREKMLDGHYESAADQTNPNKLLCEGCGERGAEEGAAAPSAA